MKVRVRRTLMPHMGLVGIKNWWVVRAGFEDLAEFQSWADAVWYAHLVAVAIERQNRVAS